MGAAESEVFTRHNLFYEDMRVSHQRADEELADEGSTTDAVLQQAVPILAAEELQHRLEGPADTGCAGLAEDMRSKISCRTSALTSWRVRVGAEAADLAAGSAVVVGGGLVGFCSC